MSVDAPGSPAPGHSTGSAAGWIGAARCLALDALAAGTSDRLTTAGIPNLLLKGPATARRLYPDQPGRRPYSDVDLLVPVDRFDAAQDVLRDHGYRFAQDGVRDKACAWHEVAWQAPGSVVLTVDLHRGFAGVQHPAAFFTALWVSRDHIELSGTTVPVPGESGTALILALHAANPGRGLKPLADIHRARAVFGIDVWREAAALARTCVAESACRAGLGLLPDGSRFADELGVGGSVSADQWLGGRQRNRVSVELALTLAQPTLAARVGYVARRTLPSPAFLRMVDHSARRGPGWLALAYLRRAAGAVAGAPRAVIDVKQARRAVRAGRSRPLARLARLAARAAGRADGRTVRAAGWALRSHRRTRRHLRFGRLSDIDVTAPPTTRPVDRRAVLAVLRARGASCLERSVVLQRFDAAAGRPRALIIAVGRPGGGFRAHAWLEGDPEPDIGLHEILRRAAPDAWVTPTPRRPGESGTAGPASGRL